MDLKSNHEGGVGRVTLLFSGGIDSTMTALKLAKTFDKVDLLTYTNGYGHYWIFRTAERANELSRLFPKKFTHSVISVRDLFEKLVLDVIDDDYRRYRSGFIWCMGCKVAMHIRTVLYNLDNGIPIVADGSSSATSEMVEQMPASIAIMKGFYREYGIAFENPVYDMARSESIEEVKRRGLRLGVRVGDRFLGVQPKCKPGELYYMPFLLLGTPPDHQESQVMAFIEAKLSQGREWITDHLGGREIEMPGGES